MRFGVAVAGQPAAAIESLPGGLAASCYRSTLAALILPRDPTSHCSLRLSYVFVAMLLRMLSDAAIERRRVREMASRLGV